PSVHAVAETEGGFVHAEIPGRPFSASDVERGGRVRRLAESIGRGEALPSEADPIEIALATRMQEGLRRGDDRHNMRLALEQVGVGQTRSREDLMQVSNDLSDLASSLRGEGRYDEARPLEAAVVRLRREARGETTTRPTSTEG